MTRLRDRLQMLHVCGGTAESLTSKLSVPLYRSVYTGRCITSRGCIASGGTAEGLHVWFCHTASSRCPDDASAKIVSNAAIERNSNACRLAGRAPLRGLQHCCWSEHGHPGDPRLYAASHRLQVVYESSGRQRSSQKTALAVPRVSCLPTVQHSYTSREQHQPSLQQAMWLQLSRAHATKRYSS